MPAYDIKNTRGSTVATINVASSTGDTFPIELIGQGVSSYGPIIAESLYHIVENFAGPDEPNNPVEGMDYYSSVKKSPSFYNGTKFVEYATATTNVAARFEMEPTASNVDFTVEQTVTLFQSPNDGSRYIPTSIMLVPVGAVTVTSPPTFNLYVDSAEDVMEDTIVASPDTEKAEYQTIRGGVRWVDGIKSLKMDIKFPATGGALEYNVHVFGYTIS